MNLLFEENISIYTDKNELFYSNRSVIAEPVKANSFQCLIKSVRDKEYRFSIGKYEGIGIIYQVGSNNYVVVATAFDQTGRNALKQFETNFIFKWISRNSYYYVYWLIFSLLICFILLLELLHEMNEISFQNISRRISEYSNKKR